MISSLTLSSIPLFKHNYCNKTSDIKKTQIASVVLELGPELLG